MACVLTEISDNYEFDELSYTHECYGVINNSDFNEYDHDDYDFSECRTAFDCINLQGNEIYINAQQSIIGDVVAELLEELADVFEVYEENAPAEHDGLKCGTNDPYGWAAHTYETIQGTCVHTNLENELFAISYETTNCCLFGCWNK